MPYPFGLNNDVKVALYEEFSSITPEFCGGILMVGTARGASFVSHGHVTRGIQGLVGELGYFPRATVDGVKRLDELIESHFLVNNLGLIPSLMAKRH